MLTQFKKADDKGFTLIELLIVIAIIGILAAIAVPIFLGQQSNANLAAAESQASSLESLVAANLSVNGAVGAVTGTQAAPNTIYIANQGPNGSTNTTNVGQLNVTEGTIAVSGTTANDYCASSTVGGVTAAYGPGAPAFVTPASGDTPAVQRACGTPAP